LISGLIGLAAATLGPRLLPETIGTFTTSPAMRVLAGLIAAAACSTLLLMYRARERVVSRPGVALVGLAVCLVPAWLFLDPLESYWIYGDDWEYVASSRTWSRMVANLFTPHNVHVVPVWRFVSWAAAASAGGLERLPDQLALFAYACLVANMLLGARFVARETNSPALGLAAAAVMGTTAVMRSAGSWFSAAQVLGASFGTLLVLWFLQCRRRSTHKMIASATAIASVAVAGWSWTVGYVAGPVGAAYLLADRPRRNWPLAVALLITPGVVGGATLMISGRAIAEQSTISFHGREATGAIEPAAAFFHTIQAIPERLLLGDLGTVGTWNIQQATILMTGIAALWYLTRRGKGAPTRLEVAGAAMLTSSYAVEWLFRGYLPFSSLRGFVPWYDAGPQVGLALMLAGWWSAARAAPGTPREHDSHPLTWGKVAIILSVQIGLAGLAAPRCDVLTIESVRKPTPSELKTFPIPRLQRLWAIYVADNRKQRQIRMLSRIDKAATVARAKGWGRRDLRPILGRTAWPDPPVIDDVDLLDLPEVGTQPVDPEQARMLFGPAFFFEPEPRPSWIGPEEVWSPKNAP
jgi:hypothetical protein